jgi:hypothetical protein
MTTPRQDNAGQAYTPPSNNEAVHNGTRVTLVNGSGQSTPNATMVGGTVVPDKK